MLEFAVTGGAKAGAGRLGLLIVLGTVSLAAACRADAPPATPAPTSSPSPEAMAVATAAAQFGSALPPAWATMMVSTPVPARTEIPLPQPAPDPQQAELIPARQLAAAPDRYAGRNVWLQGRLEYFDVPFPGGAPRWVLYVREGETTTSFTIDFYSEVRRPQEGCLRAFVIVDGWLRERNTFSGEVKDSPLVRAYAWEPTAQGTFNTCLPSATPSPEPPPASVSPPPVASQPAASPVAAQKPTTAPLHALTPTMAVAKPPLHTVSGTGSQVTEPFPLERGLVVVRGTHSGKANFIAYLIDANGNRVGLAANAIGEASSGKHARVTSGGAHRLNVTADGQWQFTIEQPTPTDPVRLPQTFSGRGDTVTGFVSLPDGLVVARSEARSGRGNFIVRTVSPDGENLELLANAVGPSQASKAFRGANRVVVVAVQAEGEWTITLEGSPG